MIVFLKIALISKWFELQIPDWSQMKYNLKMLTSETNLAPVIKPFEKYRQNFEKRSRQNHEFLSLNCKYLFYFKLMLWTNYLSYTNEISTKT